MPKTKWALVAALCGVALCGTSAQAAVKSYDLGSVPVNDSTVYFGTTGTGSFTVYEKFLFNTAPVTASVSYSDTVRFSGNAITGGLLSIYQCTSNCTGAGNGAAFTPTGTLLASAPIINDSPTAQSAGFGPVALNTAGSYYLRIDGNTTALGNGVTYTGTITLDSVGGVPEPSTWMMMLLGFAGLAFAYGRSNRAGTAIA